MRETRSNEPNISEAEQTQEETFTTVCNGKTWFLCMNFVKGKPHYYFRANTINLPKGHRALSQLPEGYEVEGTTVKKMNRTNDIFDRLHR